MNIPRFRPTEEYEIPCPCGKTHHSPTPTVNCACGRILAVHWHAIETGQLPAMDGRPKEPRQ